MNKIKKRIFSFIVALSMLLPILSITAFSAEDINSNNQYMEQYIRCLIDENTKKYTPAPFEDYNYQIVKIIENVDYNEVAWKYYIDDFNWDTFWKDYLKEFWDIDVYSEEQYQALFSDMIISLGEFAEKEKEKETEFSKERIEEIKTALTVYKKGEAIFKNDYVYKAYETLCKKNSAKLSKIVLGELPDSFQNDVEFSSNLANLELKALDYLAILLRDYESYACYLDIMKETVYDCIEQTDDKSKADAMKKGFDKAYSSYHDRASAAVTKFIDDVAKNLVSQLIKESQSTIIIGIAKDFNLGDLVGKAFSYIDLAICVKDICSETSGMRTAVASANKLQFASAFNYVYQNKFIQKGREYLSDDNFSYAEYQQMKMLFDICKTNQSLCFNYANNLNADDFWYHVNNAAGIGNENYSFIAKLLNNDEIIKRYIEYSKSQKTIDIIDRGQCGENVYWEMTEDGELIIFGDGDMYHSEYSDGIVLKAGFPVGKNHWDNTKVTHVSFEGNVTSIGNCAFGGTIIENMDGSITDTRCKNLKTITLPNTITTIGSYAFCECFNLEEIHFSDNLKNISYAAFLGCSKLKTDNISDSVENIAQRAFEGCISGTFKIPSNVTVLTGGMITDPNLRELTIPESVTSIEENFFYGLKSLEKVYMLTKNPLRAEIGVYDMTGGYKFTVYGYENAETWVKEMNNPFLNNNMGLGAFMPQSNYINYIPLSAEMIEGEKKSTEHTQIPSITEKEIEISKSEYLKAQEYLKALQIGTEDAIEEYIYNYGSGDMNPDLKLFYDTEEFFIDVYSDETFNLNFKTAYINEPDSMKGYKDKNHYVLILPENAQEIDDGYHYLVEGDGTGFKYDALPAGEYVAYVRSDLCEEVGRDLAQFKITVHDLSMDIIDEELEEAINFLKGNGAMTGYEDGSFRPNKSMTRAEFAAIVCRFTNNDIEFTGENNAFDDVFGDYWGYDYVMNAYQKGLLKGYGGGVFGIDDTLTEEQAITVLCRMIGDTYEDVEYIETYADEKGGYSDGYISIAGERGVDIEELKKNVPATRAKVAKWLYQLYNIKNVF